MTLSPDPSGRPLIKVCGLTNAADARAAVAAGADLVGLNFFPGSSRALVAEARADSVAELEAARYIAEAARNAAKSQTTPGYRLRVVAVFVDAPEPLVEAVIRTVRPDILQFHGDEPVAYCRGFHHPFMKAHRLASAADAARIADYLGGDAVGYLIDAYVPGQHGGTGRSLDGSLITAGLASPGGFLAGGLKPENVGAIVARFLPHGVDVASGVELRPRTKSRDRMVAFVNAVNAAAEKRAGAEV